MIRALGFVPIITTALGIAFAWVLYRHWRRKPAATYLLWWLVGVLTYVAGTLTESLTALLGWHEGVFRAWYITGALLGGAPLAQGTVYLLLPRRVAHLLTALVVTLIAVASACVLLSPIAYDLVEPHRLTGRVLAWTWVRGFSPFINTYAVLFLVGGALWSAVRYSEEADGRQRMVGNVWIAVGAILPGIGGSFTRFGYTEVLYVTELLGLCCIWLGYRTIVHDRSRSVHLAQSQVAAA